MWRLPKWRRRPEPVEGPLATLSPDESRRVAAERRLVEDAERRLAMLRRAVQVHWRALATKYQLPEAFEIDAGGRCWPMKPDVGTGPAPANGPGSNPAPTDAGERHV